MIKLDLNLNKKGKRIVKKIMRLNNKIFCRLFDSLFYSVLNLDFIFGNIDFGSITTIDDGPSGLVFGGEDKNCLFLNPYTFEFFLLDELEIERNIPQEVNHDIS